MPFPLKATAIRVALAVLAGLADLGIQQLSASRIESIVLFLVLSVLAGVVIARWSATLIAATCLLLAASAPPGGEDAGGAVEVLVGVELGIAQALLITVGIAAAKLVGHWRRRRWARSGRDGDGDERSS
jgi:choline-glycine betaine transporter